MKFSHSIITERDDVRPAGEKSFVVLVVIDAAAPHDVVSSPGGVRRIPELEFSGVGEDVI